MPNSLFLNLENFDMPSLLEVSDCGRRGSGENESKECGTTVSGFEKQAIRGQSLRGMASCDKRTVGRTREASGEGRAMTRKEKEEVRDGHKRVNGWCEERESTRVDVEAGVEVQREMRTAKRNELHTTENTQPERQT